MSGLNPRNFTQFSGHSRATLLRNLGTFFLFGELGKILRLVLDEAERVLGEAVQHVQTVDLVALRDRQVEAHNGQRVGLGNPQRGIQAGNKVRHLVEGDKLCGMGIELGPLAVEHLQVLLDNADLLLLVGLVEVLQNDGDVHVDDNHEVDDDEGDKVDDGDEGEAAVAVGQVLVVGVAVRRLRHQRVQHVVPASRRHQSEKRQKLSDIVFVW